MKGQDGYHPKVPSKTSVIMKASNGKLQETNQGHTVFSLRYLSKALATDAEMDTHMSVECVSNQVHFGAAVTLQARNQALGSRAALQARKISTPRQLP